MKTYTFFYHETDSVDDVEFKKYTVSVPRFDLALKSFSNFILSNNADYINFVYIYNVFNGFKTQVRSLDFSDIIRLTSVVDKHNSRKREEFN